MADTKQPVTEALVKQMAGWSLVYQNVAKMLLDQAENDFSNGTSTAEEYNDAYEHLYMPMVQKAITLDNVTLAQLGKLADANLGPIRDATAQLEAAMKTVDKVQNAVKLSAELLAAVSLVAVAVLDPTKSTAIGAGVALKGFTMDLYASIKK